MRQKIDFSNYKFRCSSLGKLVTDPRSGGGLSETTKAHLLECWISERYSRDNEIISKYMKKGVAVEEAAITQYSLQKKKFFKKNVEKLENEFIRGTPDLYVGKSVTESEEIIDIKSSWSIFTFWANFHKPINRDYQCQLLGYQALSNARKSSLAYELVSTPHKLIEDEVTRKKWEWDNIDPESDPDFNKLADYIRASMKYEDIPLSEKLIEFEIPWDENMIDKIYERCKMGRKFIQKLEDTI